MPISVVIADDHKILLEGLASLLEQAESVRLLAKTHSGEQLKQLVLELQPEIVVCDVSMPSVGAESIARWLEVEEIDAKLLALTVHEDPIIAKLILDAGARGYVLKKNAFDHLLDAIESISAGELFISPEIAGSLISGASSSAGLSNREREVLGGFARGLSYKQIAAEMKISVKTVETYRSRLLTKLNAETNADLIRYAIEIGLNP
ncbi:MAG: response regulator transcription factor [Planctomycetota bacterium]